jgi:exo-beta-1,3-glucanase (GH17 family)
LPIPPLQRAGQLLLFRIARLARRAALRRCVAALLAIVAAATAAARPVCRSDAAPALARLRAALTGERFVAYEPTSLKVVNGQVTPADPASIRADLIVLREKVDALITYDAVHGAQAIPAIAATLKFRTLIIGVWNPANAEELDAAIDAAQRFPRLVAALSLGNEMLFSHRSEPAALAALVARARQRLPNTALATTEPFHIYYQPDAAPLLAELDFLLVNVHPIFQPWFREAADSTAAQFVVNVLGQLEPLACGPMLVKETGLPSAPADEGYSEARQASFYRELRRQLPPSATRAFAYFAAFDAPWRAYDASPTPRVHPEESHWGLYDAARRPKQAARDLPSLSASE